MAGQETFLTLMVRASNRCAKVQSLCLQLLCRCLVGQRTIGSCFAGIASNDIFTFANANIISYFVMRTVVDGMPANDMKIINSRALNLFRSGHI